MPCIWWCTGKCLTGLPERKKKKTALNYSTYQFLSGWHKPSPHTTHCMYPKHIYLKLSRNGIIYANGVLVHVCDIFIVAAQHSLLILNIWACVSALQDNVSFLMWRF